MRLRRELRTVRSSQLLILGAMYGRKGRGGFLVRVMGDKSDEVVVLDTANLQSTVSRHVFIEGD